MFKMFSYARKLQKYACQVRQLLLLLLLLKKVDNAKLGESDQNPTTPTHRMKEGKGKTAGDNK